MVRVNRTDSGGWMFTWDPGLPPYALWLDGILLATVDAEEYLFEAPNYEDVPPEIEVVNAGDVAGNALFPPFVIVQWRGIVGAAAYLVQQWNGSTWVDVANVEELAEGYYHWQSGALADASVPQYRVLAMDLVGNQGIALSFTVTICRHPLAPVPTLTFTAGNMVTS